MPIKPQLPFFFYSSATSGSTAVFHPTLTCGPHPAHLLRPVRAPVLTPACVPSRHVPESRAGGCRTGQGSDPRPIMCGVVRLMINTTVPAPSSSSLSPLSPVALSAPHLGLGLEKRCANFFSIFLSAVSDADTDLTRTLLSQADARPLWINPTVPAVHKGRVCNDLLVPSTATAWRSGAASSSLSQTMDLPWFLRCRFPFPARRAHPASRRNRPGERGWTPLASQPTSLGIR